MSAGEAAKKYFKFEFKISKKKNATNLRCICQCTRAFADTIVGASDLLALMATLARIEKKVMRDIATTNLKKLLHLGSTRDSLLLVGVYIHAWGFMIFLFCGEMRVGRPLLLPAFGGNQPLSNSNFCCTTVQETVLSLLNFALVATFLR